MIVKIKYTALVILAFLSVVAHAQKKEIKVEIMHGNAIVFDTSLYESSDDAKIIIENIVQRFTYEEVAINSKITHGLYVFNISNESWKEPKSTQGKQTATKKLTPKVEQEEAIAQQDEIPLAYKTFDEDDSTETSSDFANKADFDEIDIDSLFNVFSKEIDTKWEETHLDIVIDSVGTSFNHLWKDLKSIDFANDPDLQDLKSDFQQFFDKIKATQIIVIQNGDTIKTY